MNSAIEVITWFEGNCAVPSACRSSPSTTAIRTKQVVIIRMAGARLTTPNSNSVSTVDGNPSGLVHFSAPPRPLSNSASGDGAAGDCEAALGASGNWPGEVCSAGVVAKGAGDCCGGA